MSVRCKVFARGRWRGVDKHHWSTEDEERVDEAEKEEVTISSSRRNATDNVMLEKPPVCNFGSISKIPNTSSARHSCTSGSFCR